MEELQHHGVLGMKWGVRRQLKQQAKIQARKNRSQERYDKIRTKHPNSERAEEARKKNAEIQRSNLGKTNKQIITEGALKKAGSYTLQTAAAVGILATGLTATTTVLPLTAGAIIVSAGGTLHRRKIDRDTVKKVGKNIPYED